MKQLLIIISLSVVLGTSIPQFVEVQSIPCLACRTMVKQIQNGEASVRPELNFFLEKIALAVCFLKKMETFEVCRGAINEMTPTIVESVVTRYLDADEICPLVKMCPQVYERLNAEDFIQEVLKDKPQDSEWPEVQQGGKTIKVIHMSDLHFDLKYKEGAKANCNKPLCCREESGTPKKGDVLAGHWGTLASCNIPQRTIEQLFLFMKEHIVQEGERYLLFWTGDNTSHDVWEQSKESNILSTKIATDLLKKTFPNGEVQIFPQTGNHEAYPVNVFDFKSEREVAFREEIAELWREWIGDSAADSLKHNGFYKVEIEDLNFKVLAFDSQICNPDNWYLIKDPTDPSGFLEWARKELYDSEAKNQAVYITAHIYTSSCTVEWGLRFKALVDRFQRIVRSQIYGHSHGEFFQLYRDRARNQSISVAWVSSSVTTFSNLNPSFRVFEVDQATMIPLNYQQYRLNLNKANSDNLEGPLVWENVFNFLEEYGSKSLRPKDLDELVERVLNDEELAKKFYRNHESGNWQEQEHPDLRDMYCRLKSSDDVQSGMCTSGAYISGLEDKIVRALHGKWRRKINH